MLKYKSSIEHQVQVKADAVRLAAEYLQGAECPVRPKDLVDASQMILDALHNWYEANRNKRG